jgi:hypothetical protein
MCGKLRGNLPFEKLLQAYRSHFTEGDFPRVFLFTTGLRES